MRMTDLFLTLPLLAVLLTASKFLDSSTPTSARDPHRLSDLDQYRAHRARRLPRPCARRSTSRPRRAAGAGDLRIMLRHMIPNSVGPIVVAATLIDRYRDRARGDALVPRLRHPPAHAGARRACIDEGQEAGLDKWWLVTYPGLADRAHHPLHQLHRRRPPRGIALDPTQRRRPVPEPTSLDPDLVVEFATEDGVVQAVDGISYDLYPGETLGIVGESGSGKSVSTMSLLGLIPQPPGKVVRGEALFKGIDLLKISKKELRHIRGNEVAMIFQDPMTSLNPVLQDRRADRRGDQDASS